MPAGEPLFVKLWYSSVTSPLMKAATGIVTAPTSASDTTPLLNTATAMVSSSRTFSMVFQSQEGLVWPSFA